MHLQLSEFERTWWPTAGAGRCRTRRTRPGPAGEVDPSLRMHGRVSGMKSPDTSPAAGGAAPPRQTLRRPMRSDAQKNRERLLVAAGQVFEEKGLEASVADVARAAGVGMGTLYRRFPSKEALIEALVTEVLEATIAMAEDAATSPDGTGLEHFLRASSAYQAEHLGCLPKLWQSDHHLVRTARDAHRRPARRRAGARPGAPRPQEHRRLPRAVVDQGSPRNHGLERTRGVEAASRPLGRRHAPVGGRAGAPAAQPEPGRPDPLQARQPSDPRASR